MSPVAQEITKLRRKAGVNVHPGLFPRSKRCGYPFVRGDLLVLVGGSELSVGDLEYCSAHTTVVSAVERDVGMMCLADRGHDLRVLDPDQRRLEPGKLVPLPLEQPSERRQLHVFLLESAIRKE